MTALAHRRARVARVRRVQHLQASGAVAVAEGRLTQLQDSEARLETLRASLAAGHGASSGAALGSIGELAMRLDAARTGLAQAIGQAREVVDLRTGERRDAHIARESAERLQIRAVAAMHAEIEAHMVAAIRPRTGKTHG